MNAAADKDQPAGAGKGTKLKKWYADKTGLAHSMAEDDIKNYDLFIKNRLKSITNHITEYFPSVMFFHTMIVSIVAIRAPTDFAVALCLFAMLMRIIIVFGYYCNKKIVYVGCGIIEAFINFVLLFIAMGYNQHDLIPKSE
jgi:hypothetical protein